ncbi:MAG: hypothetical protein AAB534_03475 [Patescibacteria group bacterium]
MIHIEKGQTIKENQNLIVISPTGDYDDTALIESFDVSNPKISTGSYQAQYVKYGNLVYRFNDPKDLGNEILKIDPESEHGAAAFVRMNDELLKRMNDGTMDSFSLEKIPPQKPLENEIRVAPVSTTTPNETNIRTPHGNNPIRPTSNTPTLINVAPVAPVENIESQELPATPQVNIDVETSSSNDVATN